MNKKLLLIIFGLTGMTALIYEIIWIRPLSLVYGTTIYAVSTIIASFILGLAVGSWLAGKYTDRLQNPLRYFAFTQLGVGFYGILLLPIFGALPDVYLGLYHATFPNQSVFMFTQILMAIAMISIPATLMGTTLPLMMRTYSKEFTTVGKDVGKLDASNSFGAVVGTLAAGFLLIPILGIQYSIIVTASINIMIAIVILSTKKYLKPKHLAIIIVIVISLFVLNPGYDGESLQFGIYAKLSPDITIEKMNFYAERGETVFYKDSLYQTVSVTLEDDIPRLRLNGKVQCSLEDHTVSGLNKLGVFPINIYEHNYGTPQTALNVGLGCGITSKILSERLETTTIEIDAAVVEANEFFHEPINHRLIIDDGRNWLLKNDEKFDIIVTEPSDPYHNNGILFTKEFFSLLNSRLTENGIVSQWVPVWELPDENFTIFYNTFHSVFPYVYVYYMEPNSFSQLIFIGSQKPLEVTDNEFYFFNHEDIIDTETELNTDDKPIIEFVTALSLYNEDELIIHIPIKTPENLKN